MLDDNMTRTIHACSLYMYLLDHWQLIHWLEVTAGQLNLNFKQNFIVMEK